MDVRWLEPDVLFAFLPPEPLAQRELRSLWKYLSEREPVHLVVDLSRVEIITSPGIGTLLLLRKLQSDRGVRLLLCRTRLATKCILRVVGLDTIFDFAEDKPEALKMLRQWPQRATEAVGPTSNHDLVLSNPWSCQASGLIGS